MNKRRIAVIFALTLAGCTSSDSTTRSTERTSSSTVACVTDTECEATAPSTSSTAPTTTIPQRNVDLNRFGTHDNGNPVVFLNEDGDIVVNCDDENVWCDDEGR